MKICVEWREARKETKSFECFTEVTKLTDIQIVQHHKRRIMVMMSFIVRDEILKLRNKIRKTVLEFK